jgi:hypothetical protein
VGYLTQGVGVGLAAILILWNERFSLSPLGACIGGVILGGMVCMMGYMARRGDRNEVVELSLLGLVLFNGLALYGAMVLEPLDALGVACMLSLGAGAIVGARSHFDIRTGVWLSTAKVRAVGFLYLLFFLGWYVYLGLRPWFGP